MSARFAIDEEDFLITDSEFAFDGDGKGRPSLKAGVLASPRSILALPLMGLGLTVSAANVAGYYGTEYVSLINASGYLGLLCATATAAQVLTNSNISPNKRHGMANDRFVNLYAGFYTLSVSLLSLRSSSLCPSFLEGGYFGEGVFCVTSIITFLSGVLFSAYTVLAPGNPQLTPTERLRGNGLVAVSVLGAVFIPDCLAFLLGSSKWWDDVANIFPNQQILESSTAAFALYANEASMVSSS